MTNGDYIRANLTDDAIAGFIHLLWCADGKCDQCPFTLDCNITFDKLEKENGVAPSCRDIVNAILKLKASEPNESSINEYTV